MSLAAGHLLGPYQILAPIGAGGMGEVYRARDTKLNRDVAIKVLPAALANDADYLARFQREAQVLASLNHPNIAAIYGLEGNAIVMELVEGETLTTPLELDVALHTARQIAEALEAAHERGVIHRDLKPGNIKVTPDGTVKVLDFGLAKAIEQTSSISTANSPTLTVRATQAGIILGTAGYMSPEQAAGKPADRRADIWSFGVVLYEMLSGKRLFDGESISHTLADVLRAPIDFSQLPPATPPTIRELLRRCLDRNLKTRLQHIGEARIAIDTAKTAPPEPTPAATAAPKTSRLPWLVAAAALALIAVAGWGMWWRRAQSAPPPVAFEIDPPPGTQFGTPTSGTEGSAISPDGRTIAFVAIDSKGDAMLYLRPLDSLVARLVPGTRGANHPVWSPDNKLILFSAGGKLQRVDLTGRNPVPLAEIAIDRGVSTNDEGVILFASSSGPGIQRTSTSGVAPSVVTRADPQAGDIRHVYPQFLPGGKEFIYLIANKDQAKTGIAIGSLDAKRNEHPVVIQQTPLAAHYHAGSKLLFYIQGDSTLMARRLELDPPGLAGDPIVVAESVRRSLAARTAEFSISVDGSLSYGRGGGSRKVRFSWRDRKGALIQTFGDPIQAIGSFQLSPDETRLAYYAGPVLLQSDVWVMDLPRALSTRISFNHGITPRWSLDGKFLYYNNSTGIYRKAADGSGEEVRLAQATMVDYINSVAPDGSALLFGNADIHRLPLTGGAKPEPFLKTEHVEWQAAFSPDGRWIAYQSNESGRPEIYVLGYPDKRGKWLISNGGGYSPVWRRDGKEIFWAGANGFVMSATVELTGNSVRPGPPQQLFRLPEVLSAILTFQVSRDGQKFLVYEPEAPAQERPTIAVIQNWTAGMTN